MFPNTAPVRLRAFTGMPLDCATSPRFAPNGRGRKRVRAELDPDAGGLRLPQPSKSAILRPSLWLSAEDAVIAQLKALQQNSFPSHDQGIETLYRFAGFDPWTRSNYFGRSLDLGQFERFRRIVYTKCFHPLVNHTSHEVISRLEVSDDVWKCRVRVENQPRKAELVYSWTMQRRVGGRYDGLWYCMQLVADDCDESGATIYGVI